MKSEYLDTGNKNLLARIALLPSLSPVVERIGKVLADPGVSAEDVVAVLKLDPAIAGKILKLANSAYIGIPRTVSSLQNAVVILGQRRIYFLILAVSTLSSFNPDTLKAFSVRSYWKHSVTVAAIAESISKSLKRFEAMEEGEAFCAGILHDIGKLALGIYEPQQLLESYNKASNLAVPLYMQENPRLSHASIGAIIAEQWNFPQSLVQAIAYHHNPQQANENRKIIAIVHVSDCIAHIIGVNTVSQEFAPAIDERALQAIGLEPTRLKVIANNALAQGKQLESLLEFFSV